MDTSAFDREVRLSIYRWIVDEGRPSTAPEVAGSLGVPASDVEAAFRRLADTHAIVLAPGTPYVWMANPFFGDPHAVRGHRRRSAVLRQLHLGRARDPRVPTRRREHRHVLPRLRGAAVALGSR